MEKWFIILIAGLLLSGFTLQAQSITGDVNSSGHVDIVDALLVAQYYVGMNPSGFNPDVADVDGNSNIDIVDALLIAQYDVGIISLFPADQAGGVEVVASDLPRNTAPDATSDELHAITAGINQFALNNYQLLNDEGGNVFISPLSIYYALAMCYAGAGGNTKTEMADTMNITLADDRYHNAMNALENTISNVSAPASTDGGTPPPTPAPSDDFILYLANSSWGQQGYNFLQDYLKTLAVNYGAGMNLVDFYGDPEGSRLLINDWVYRQTNGRISDLLPRGSIHPSIVLALTNVIYFKANWFTPFDRANTVDGQFNQEGGETVTVPMMHKKIRAAYMEVPGQYQAVKLEYYHGISEPVSNYMVIILPENLESFENDFTYDVYNSILGSMARYDITLAMPRFGFEYEKEMKDTLLSLGMVDAFTPGDADFSGINGGYDLYIEKIYHKSFVSVDEKGTEAAAATVGLIVPNVLPPQTMTIDRPFIFMVMNANPSTILFIGRAAEL